MVAVDGGGGWWSKKKFFNFAETWHSCYVGKINVRNFRVFVKQLFYGNEIQFFQKKFTGDFSIKKFSKGILNKNEP